MNKPKENDQYKLFVDSFNYIVLSVSFVESNVVWLLCGSTSYKYDRNKDKLYKWVGDGYDAVDMQYGFNRLSSDDVWKERQQQSSVDYVGFYGE
jgi:hypothetical protein